MRKTFLLTAGLTLLGTTALVFGSFSEKPKDTSITWKKTVLDTKFRAEGICMLDVDKDGKKDIFVGDYWYKAPKWEMQKVRKSDAPDGFDPSKYSTSFSCFVGDFNKDSWDDVLVIPFPGAQCYWYENPKNSPGNWPEHPVWRSACNESPVYADLFKNGSKVLVMGIEPERQMCWFQFTGDAKKPWDIHPISETKAPGTEKFSHGLGVADVNGDSRPDVLCTGGWWEQPEDAKTRVKPWKFHAVDLGPACSHMHTMDIDGDGKLDVLSTSAHQQGLWWHRQLADGKFERKEFSKEFSQTHATEFVDMNGDGKLDLVTGKRWWAHGPKGDVNPEAPAVLRWFDISKKDGKPVFTSHAIDEDSGVGTGFEVGDINGDGFPDVVIANKKGVFLFEQVRK